MTRLLDVAAFKAAAKEGTRPDCAVMRATNGEPVVGDGESRTVTFVFSDATVDRMGDTIDPKGWDLSDFNKNAVALWCHDSSMPPIGRASNVRVERGKLLGDIEFMDAETSAFADSVFRMVKGGYLKAVSVGFIPTKYVFVEEADRPWGIDFIEQTLLEISVCSVPANPNALIAASASGIDVAPLREWASKLLDDGSNVTIPRDFLEEIFRAAKTPRTVRQRYLSQAAHSEWKCGALGDLTLIDAPAWDARAAARRMLDATGDGAAFDPAVAQRGFLQFDAANPTLRSSYRLPFADVIDGELKAVRQGLIAASAGLAAQTGAEIDKALDVVIAYEAHYPALDEAAKAAKAPPVVKAGKKVGAENMAHIQQAMDHHASASACLQKVIDSNATAEPDDEDVPGDPANDIEIEQTDEQKRLKRIAEAKALAEAVGKLD